MRVLYYLMAVSALLATASSPALEVAACPLLNPQHHASHPCCPKSKPVVPKLPACLSACAISGSGPVLTGRPTLPQNDAVFSAAPDHELAADPAAPLTAVVLDPSPPGQDLYLRLGVIRR